MEIVKLTREHPRAYFSAVADLHFSNIHHGLLPMLGLRFLEPLYYELARAPRCGVWIAIEKDDVLGFVAGCASITQAYRFVLINGARSLVVPVLRGSLNPRVIRRLPTILAHPLKVDPADSIVQPRSTSRGAELLAIAVDSRWQNKGIGRHLVEALERSLHEWKVDRYFVSTNTAEVGSNAFYKSIGFVAYRQEPHNDLILQVYSKSLAPVEREKT